MVFDNQLIDIDEYVSEYRATRVSLSWRVKHYLKKTKVSKMNVDDSEEENVGDNIVDWSVIDKDNVALNVVEIDSEQEKVERRLMITYLL